MKTVVSHTKYRLYETSSIAGCRRMDKITGKIVRFILTQYLSLRLVCLGQPLSILLCPPLCL